MDILIFAFSFVLLITGNIFYQRAKSRLKDEQIIYFGKKIKPTFAIYYLIGLAPMVVFVMGLLFLYFEVLDYFWYMFIITLVWEGFSYYKLNRLISLSPFPKDYNHAKIYFLLIYTSMLLVLIAMKVSLDAILLSAS